MGYTDRYEILIGRTVDEFNKYCETLKGRRLGSLPLHEQQKLYELNKEYCDYLGATGEIDPGEFQVFDKHLATIYHRTLKEVAETEEKETTE